MNSNLPKSKPILIYCKSMHSMQKIGTYWSHIPGYQDRQTCQSCGRIETMEHILITCNNCPTRVIWQLAREIWPSRTYNWPEISLGLILGCRTITFPRGDAHPDILQVEQNRRMHHTKGATCLIQITLT